MRVEPLEAGTHDRVDVGGRLDLARVPGGAVATLLVQLVLIPRLKPTPRRMMIVGPLFAMAGLSLLAIHPSYGVIVAGIIIANTGFAIARPGVAVASSFVVPMERAIQISDGQAGPGAI